MDKRQLLEQTSQIGHKLLERQKNDPMRTWKPHDKQKVFINDVLEGKVQEAWMVCANRVGKSEAGAFVGSHLARYGPHSPDSIYSGQGGEFLEVKDRATSGWVVSLDFPSSRDIIQPKYFNNGMVAPGAGRPFIPDREISEWRKSDQILKLKNGSLIGFKSADSDVTKFYGTGKDWVHFDEEPPKSHYDESVIRVEAGRKLLIFGTCTILPPEGVQGGVSWLFSHIIRPCQANLLPGVKIYTASIYDNPYIDREEIRRLESKYPEGSAIRRIRLDGELIPGIGGSRAYGAFDNALHVREQPDYNSRKPLCWMWDFNVEPLITYVGQRDGEMFRVKDQLYLESGSIPDMVELYYSRFNWWRGQVWVYGDATGQNRGSQTAITDYTMMFNEFRKYGIQAAKKVPLQNPPVVDRINAMNVALNDGGIINLEVDPSCTELIEDLEQVLLDPKGGIKKSHNPRDEYYKRTHASDGVGYWVVYDAPVRAYRRNNNEIEIKNVSYAFR